MKWCAENIFKMPIFKKCKVVGFTKKLGGFLITNKLSRFFVGHAKFFFLLYKSSSSTETQIYKIVLNKLNYYETILLYVTIQIRSPFSMLIAPLVLP